MYRLPLLATAIVSAMFVLPAQAEKASMSPESLKKVATHVVTGQVMAVYQRTEEDSNWKYVRYVAEIRVKDCEKGEGVKGGDLVYVRYWEPGWVGTGLVPPSTSGHRGLPNGKDHVRVYLSRNAYDGFSDDNKDGGFNVIGANGFEILKATPGK